jgi:hypothetical protein
MAERAETLYKNRINYRVRKTGKTLAQVLQRGVAMRFRRDDIHSEIQKRQCLSRASPVMQVAASAKHLLSRLSPVIVCNDETLPGSCTDV